MRVATFVAFIVEVIRDNPRPARPETESLFARTRCRLFHVHHVIRRSAPPWVATYCYTCERWRDVLDELVAEKAVVQVIRVGEPGAVEERDEEACPCGIPVGNCPVCEDTAA